MAGTNTFRCGVGENSAAVARSASLGVVGLRTTLGATATVATAAKSAAATSRRAPV
eukprot:COSAG06_NODE_6005_length_3159_cov_2.436601_4_plen_55_part_01